MNKSWPQVPLSEFLIERREVPSEESLAIGETPIVAKIGFQDGRIQLRNDGQTKTGMILIRPGDLVVSGINAAKGAIAVYEEENSIPIAATIHYGAYIPNKERIDITFLWWLLRSRTFKDLLLEYVPGGIKTELKAKRLLPIPIPLPRLPDQQRIVARIEALTDRIERIRKLRKSTEEDSENLCRSLIFSNSKSSTLTPMSDLVSLREPDVSVKSDETYHFAGVYCFGKGVFRGQRKSGMEFAYPLLTKIRKENFVYPKLMAWEGAFGVVPEECDGLVVSTEFPVFKVNKNCVLPEVLDVYFRTPSVWPLLAGASTGTNVRRRRLNPKDFLNYQIPLPPMPVQEKLAKLKPKVDDLKELQVETNGEFNALLPSILDKAFKGEL
jgi:type I restriction enzyme, S subunit